MILKYLVLLCVISCTLAFYAGEYIPKSFYKIHDGHKSATYYIDMNYIDPLLRQRRGLSASAQSSASASASASAHSSPGDVGYNAGGYQGRGVPGLSSRFAEDNSGFHAEGNLNGGSGVYSSSKAYKDSSGRGYYSVDAGKLNN